MMMGPEVWQIFIFFVVVAAGIVMPIILVILLTVWLINKKRRDNLMIERLVQIKQTLDEIRERMNRDSERR